jgi:hypothetical protein
VKFFNGAHRFLPTLIRMEGFRAVEVPVSTNPRFSGTSHYGRLESLVQIVPRFACGTLDEIVTDTIRNRRERQLIIDRFLAHSICLFIGKRRGLG